MLKRCDFDSQVKSKRPLLFPSVLDAVHFAKTQLPERSTSDNETTTADQNNSVFQQQPPEGDNSNETNV